MASLWWHNDMRHVSEANSAKPVVDEVVAILHGLRFL
jgi:hypothetical protein